MTGYIIKHEGKEYDPNGRVGVKDVDKSNAEISRAEVEWFKNEKPSRHFAYVKELQHIPYKVTTWTGETLGDVVWYGAPYKIPAFGHNQSTRQNLRIKAINGLLYSAIYYKSSGDYCRMKVISSSKPKGEKANG